MNAAQRKLLVERMGRALGAFAPLVIGVGNRETHFCGSPVVVGIIATWGSGQGDSTSLLASCGRCRRWERLLPVPTPAELGHTTCLACGSDGVFNMLRVDRAFGRLRIRCRRPGCRELFRFTAAMVHDATIPPGTMRLIPSVETGA